MVKCQVVGCENEAEYYDEIHDPDGGSRSFKVKVCKECLLSGWVFNAKDEEDLKVRKQDVLDQAEKING
jgi:hypothetical protein